MRQFFCACTLLFTINSQCSFPLHTLIADVIEYFSVLDQVCDNKDTLLNVISELHTEFIMSNKKKYILLEGDQVTYQCIQSIKKEYGNDLAIAIPW